MYTVENYLKEDCGCSRGVSEAINYLYLVAGAYFAQVYGFLTLLISSALALGLVNYLYYLYRAKKSEEGILRDLI